MSVIQLIERAGNLVLSLDPETLDELAHFKGKVFCIEIQDPNYTLHLTPDTEGFSLNGAPTKEADVTLSGSLWSFIKLAREGGHSDVFHTGRIRMQGDAELGQAFQKVMMQLDIDWEEITSKMVGDFASRQLHNVMAEIKTWFGNSSNQFKQNLGEVLQEEWKTVPATIEVEQFTDEVEKLRADADRLEARVRALRDAQQSKPTQDNTN